MVFRLKTTVVGFRRRTSVLGSEHQMENNSGGLHTATRRWRTTVVATDQQQQSWWVNFRQRTIVMG